MRVFTLRTLLSLTLAALVSSTAFAGVRGKAAKPQESAMSARRLAQSDSENVGVNSPPVPALVDANITNERVIHERPVEPAATINNVQTRAPAAVRSNVIYSEAPMLQTPMIQAPLMMAAPMTCPPTMQMEIPVTVAMPMVAGSGCSTCRGGAGGSNGLSPANAAIYEQAFGPGLYRSGAEVGQYHFPYYSYRRPWYFPGQPSFHRSTDYVW